MSVEHTTRTVINFGPFEVDTRTQELKKHGVRLRLPGQSFQILAMLLQKPGELVAREELQRALWPADTHVDFERGVNAAINRLRDVVGDSADSPHLIETLPRRGYRFIGTVIKPTGSAVFDASAAMTGTLTPAQVKDDTNGRLNRLKVGILVFAACAFAIAFTYIRFRPSAESAVLTPVPFTTYPGREVCPTFSPDGTQIAFAWDGEPGSESKGFDLYVKLIKDENVLRLTHHPSGFICPAWSPDGTQIAFHRLSGADTGLYVIPALGGSERKLRSTHIPFEVSTPISWSADGHWIAYKDFLPPEGAPRVLLLSLETLESKQIPHKEECGAETQPAFSHSGGLLAYLCNFKSSEFAIYSVPVSGGSPKVVTRFMTDQGWPGGLAWTGNDKKLILSRPRSGMDFELDEVTIADGTIKKLPLGQDAFSPAFSPAISPKGDKLAYAASSFHHIDIWRKDLLDPDAAAVRIISSTHDQAAPQYSPDGKHIAFSSNRGGPWEIWMSDADGTHLVLLSDAKRTEAGAPYWSPDSQRIAFDSRHSGHPEVYVVDISERMPRKVVTNLPDMSSPSWSRDGKWLYFESSTADIPASRVFRAPVGGGDAVVVSRPFGVRPLESYDGKTLYFASIGDQATVHTLSLEAPGTESVLGDMPVGFHRTQWTVAPKGIYFVPGMGVSGRSYAFGRRADAAHSVRYFDFATKQVRQVFEAERVFNDGLSVSSDGRWILYTQEDQESSDIMVVDHFE
jgi:Tol biopolymer transport system component/DNA-binding winged helix-turn-helix (wHTH) protein